VTASKHHDHLGLLRTFSATQIFNLFVSTPPGRRNVQSLATSAMSRAQGTDARELSTTDARNEAGGFPMEAPSDRLWSDEETERLIQLWRTHSAGQIAQKLQRSRSAVCGKIGRLRQKGIKLVFDGSRLGGGKRPHLALLNDNALLAPKRRRAPAPEDPLAARPCGLLQLNDKRCHWPLEASRLFCGGQVLEGSPYCPYHSRKAFKEDHRPRRR
jgi:GcrA cell cycle regulator